MLRVPVRQREDGTTVYVQTFVMACQLYQQGSQTTLYDAITIHVDAAGRPQSVGLSAGTKDCDAKLPKRQIAKMKTKMTLKRSETGPTPFLDAYLAELEKVTKEQQGGGDSSSSFLGKYWMYILPVYVGLIVLQNSAPAEGGEGGGGGGGGGGGAPAAS